MATGPACGCDVCGAPITPPATSGTPGESSAALAALSITRAMSSPIPAPSSSRIASFRSLSSSKIANTYGILLPFLSPHAVWSACRPSSNSSSIFAPASSSACLGLVISICSKPCVTRKATLRPLSRSGFPFSCGMALTPFTVRCQGSAPGPDGLGDSAQTDPVASDRVMGDSGLVTQDLEERIDALMTRHHVPATSVHVRRAGEVLLSAGFGKAGVGRAATADTVVRVASITKSLSCLAVMQLADNGRLRTNQRVADFFSTFNRPGWDGIELHHLMSNSSGLPPMGFRRNGLARAIEADPSRELLGLRMEDHLPPLDSV